MSTAVTVAPPTSETIASIPTSESAPPKKPPVKRKRVIKEDEEDLDECLDETRSVDSEDAGSLVDFIVKDNDDDANDDDDNESVESDGPKNEEEARQRDLDGIDSSNIITGKRTRRQTAFYEQTVFNSDEYRKMMLDDVPDDEMHVLEESESSGEDDESDEEDGSYKENENEDEEEEESDDDDANGSQPPPTPMKSKSPARDSNAK